MKRHDPGYQEAECRLERKRRFVVAACCLPGLLLSLAVGCGQSHVSDDLAKHVVMFDKDAQPVRMDGGVMDDAEYGKQIDGVLGGLDKYVLNGPVENKRVMLFVHGGLNHFQKSLQLADKVLKEIRAERGADSCYPVFILWDSDLISSYGEHLVDIRQGRKENGLSRAYGPLTVPLFLFADLGRAVSRAPVVWLHQVETDRAVLESVPELVTGQLVKENWAKHPQLEKALAYFYVLNDLYAADRSGVPEQGGSGERAAVAVSVGESRVEFGEWLLCGASFALTVPTKIVSGPVIDAFGSSAWGNMSRRTKLLFEGLPASNGMIPSSDAVAAENLRYWPANERKSHLVQFLVRLSERVQSANTPVGSEQGKGVRVTLIGHSMGTMIVNQILGLQQSRAWRNPLPVADIVYMAAACSVRDFAEVVIPYLQSNRGTRFYDLCLHPVAELLESNIGDLPQRGSLLVWLDSFLGEPQTPLDRTLGRWENIIPSVGIIPDEVRGRVTVKAFGLTDPVEKAQRGNPQRHGDFTEDAFWKQAFWEAGKPREKDDAVFKILKKIWGDQADEAGGSEQQGVKVEAGR